MRIYTIAIIYLLLAPLSVIAQSLPIENDAMALAVADLRTIPEDDQYYTRYIWIKPEAADTLEDLHEEMQATALALAYISRSTILARPLPLGKDKLLIMRVDYRRYSPSKGSHRREWRETWEELQYDPTFNLLITKDTFKFIAGLKVPKIKVRKQELITVPPYISKDGYTYRKKLVWKDTYSDPFTNNIDVVRQVGDQLDKELYAELSERTKSQAPIVAHRYFISRALTTIRDKGAYKTIYGGLYYDFTGIRQLTQRGKKGTDEDKFFESLGIGNIEAGVTAKIIFDKIPSDQRVGVFRSGVTGRPRQIEFLRTLYSRDSESFLSITHDLRKQDIDVGTHPMMNLINFKDFAREVIFVTQTGIHGFVIFNGKGALVDEVPAEVAADTTIPVPNGTRLEPAIGCIRCHAPDGGWQIVKNDVKKLVSRYLDIFGDFHKFPKHLQADIERLAGLYAGDPEIKLLPRGRDDYATAILKATGPWKKSKNQIDLVKRSGQKLSEIYKYHNYDMIDARKALLELGIIVDPKLVPKDKAKEMEFYGDELKKRLKIAKVMVYGIIPEDPRIGALLVGLSVNRSDFDLVYSPIAARIKRVSLLGKEKVKK